MQKKYVVRGVSTYNKGAELMLYAILQQIEERHPDAIVYLDRAAIPEGLGYIKTRLTLKSIKPYLLCRLQAAIDRFRLESLFRKLRLWTPLFFRKASNVEIVFDASGLKFSDLMYSAHSERNWRDDLNLYTGYKDKGARVVLLPQQFGPFERDETRNFIKELVGTTDLVFAREKKSFDYLKSICDNSNIYKFTDFTSLVDGVVPEQYSYLAGKICIIPNLQMVNKKMISRNDYIDLLAKFVKKVSQSGKSAYLLNHEGIGDKELCYSVQEKANERVDVVSGLNALEIKGLISTSYLCISSRYHGVASALNSATPCLATSWSHKYDELFKDFGQSDCVLDIKDETVALKKIEAFLEPNFNQKIREELKTAKEQIVSENKKMWGMIWGLGY